MQAVLTDGRVAYALRAVFDRSEQQALNQPLRRQPCPESGCPLEWRLTDEGGTWPPAPLRDRALVALRVEEAQAAYLAEQRQAEELERQQSELERLLRACLGLEANELTFAIQDSLEPLLAADDLTVFLQAEAEELCFRLAPCHSGSSRLQVALPCPACQALRWESITGLAELGRALRSLEEPDAICPLCQRLAEMADDPFHNE